MKLNIVLVEPEIPQNTGNIVRTCSVTGAKLHLVYPLGFTIDNKKMIRSGLDYWNEVDIEYHVSFEEFLKKYDVLSHKMYLTSSKGRHCYADVDYKNDLKEIDDENVFILFGKETKGLPEDFLAKYEERTIRIPMLEKGRCLNLSNSVGIVGYEVLRQFDFEGLKEESTFLDNGIK